MDAARRGGDLFRGRAGGPRDAGSCRRQGSSIELLIDNLQEELRDQPYEIVFVAGGWQHRTRSRFAVSIRASQAPTRSAAPVLSDFEAMVLMAIAYFQPITRGDLSKIFGKEVSRDTIASLRNANFLASGPRSPTPGAPYTYVTTKQFLIAFGIETLRDLPDIEALEDAGCSVETACRRKRRQVRLRRTRNSDASRSGRHPLVNFRSYICSSTLADFYRIVYQ